MKALFVDGVGREQERHVSEALSVFRFPMPSKLTVGSVESSMIARTDVPIAEFDRLGRLPDGREVYGYRFTEGPQFGIWTASGSWVDGAPEQAIQAVADEIARNVDALNASAPMRVLYDHTDFDKSSRVHVRRLVGVARRRDVATSPEQPVHSEPSEP